MLKAAATDSTDSRNPPALTDDRTQSSNPALNGEVEVSEVPNPTLEELHFKSNFKPRNVGEQTVQVLSFRHVTWTCFIH
jgi:hypothetical protein